MKIEGSISQRNGSAFRILIHTKMSWIRNTGYRLQFLHATVGIWEGRGGGGGTATDLLQLVGEALLAGELVLLQGEQQLLVVLHRVPAHQQQISSLRAGLRTRIHFIRIWIRIQHLRLNTDPDPGL
jgi:hypothetical protein